MGKWDDLIRTLGAASRSAPTPSAAYSANPSALTPGQVERAQGALDSLLSRPGMPGGPKMQNLIHDRPALQVGEPGPMDHITEQGWVYRTLLPDELSDARNTGYFLPRASGKSRGGAINAKHWVRGGTGEPVQFFKSDMGKNVIRVPDHLILPDSAVRAQDVFLAEPGWKWRSFLQ